MEVIGTDARADHRGQSIILGMDVRGRGYYQVLVTDPRRPGAFRRLPAGFDNLLPSVEVVNDLRQAGQLGASANPTRELLLWWVRRKQAGRKG